LKVFCQGTRRNQEERRKGGKKLKSKDYGRIDRVGNLLSIDLYKIETMLENNDKYVQN
jgi:hypothetical protein